MVNIWIIFSRVWIKALKGFGERGSSGRKNSNGKLSILKPDKLKEYAIKMHMSGDLEAAENGYKIFLHKGLKGTSLAYIIGFHDLMLLGKRWANAPVPGSEPFIIFPLMAVMYFCLCYPLAIYAKHIERKTLFNN